MKSTVLCVTFVFEKHEYKQKEVGDGPLFKKTPWKVYNIGKMSSYFKPFLPTPSNLYENANSMNYICTSSYLVDKWLGTADRVVASDTREH